VHTVEAVGVRELMVKALMVVLVLVLGTQVAVVEQGKLEEVIHLRAVTEL
jgi:hypothetical protein